MPHRLLPALLVALLVLTAACSSGEPPGESAEAPPEPGLGGQPDDEPDEGDEGDEPEDAAPPDAAGEPVPDATPPPAQPLPGIAPVPADPGPVPTSGPLSALLPEPDDRGFIAAADEPRSTFALDVDTASYDLARAEIEAGRDVDPDRIRPEEFLNALDYGYEAVPDATFTVSTDVAPWPHGDDPDHALLRIGIAGAPAVEDHPSTVVFAVDTSAGMADHLAVAREGIRAAADALGPEDAVALVTFDDDPAVALGLASADDRRLDKALRDLTAAGGSDVGAGLAAAYEVAAGATKGRVPTRVVLVSAGLATTGASTVEEVLAQAVEGARDDVVLSTVAVGDGAGDRLMEQLADRGNGSAAYAADAEEAARLFADGLRLDQPAIARDARVQVAFDPAQVAGHRLIGYENRVLDDDDFADDDVVGGAVVAGHAVTALYELRLTGEGTGDPLAGITLRWLDPQTSRPQELAHPVTVEDISPTWEGAPASFRLAATVAAWAEHLEGGRVGSADEVRLRAEVQQLAQEVPGRQTESLARVVLTSLG